MRYTALLAVLSLALFASPLQAAVASSAPVAPVFATYWDGFLDHWGGMLKKQNGIIMFALGVGALSLFIITRGKWNK